MSSVIVNVLMVSASLSLLLLPVSGFVRRDPESWRSAGAGAASGGGQQDRSSPFLRSSGSPRGHERRRAAEPADHGTRPV